MNSRINDDHLIAVLEGRASTDLEQAVELAIQEDPSVRLRMEQLSGAIDWPVGSALDNSITISESLHTAILKLEHDWDQVLATHTKQDKTDSESKEEFTFPEIPSVRIVREIGRGGMGVVYEGIDDALCRRVAIKQLHPQFYSDIRANERLRREAQAIAALNHPNILAIHGLQLVDGLPCMIQQFVDGESLQTILRREGAIPFPRCTDLALQISQGLAAAHALGIVHRDLKPDNVLVEHGTGVARLCDFGLAKRAGEDNMTVEGVVAGTPAYMAPEQTDGKVVEHRSDLFSLGSLLYTMAIGQPPFQGDNPFVVMQAIRCQPHTPLDSLSDDIPSWYARLVDRLLAKDPMQRLQHVDQVVDAIQKKTSPPPAYPPSQFTLSTAMATVAIFAVTAVGGFWMTYQSRDLGSKQTTAVIPSTPIPTRPAICTESNGKSFERLEDAVATAIDGETIVIASDLQTGRIDITGKNLHFEAAPDTRPTIQFRNPGNDSSNVFLRSDSHLSFKGLRLQCQTNPAMPWFEDGKFIAGIYTGQGKRLQIEDCEIYRNGGGICLGAGGDLEMRRTWIEGGDVGIAWFALDNTCRVDESLIHSKIGIGVIYPGANMKQSRSAEFVIQKSSFVTEEVLDLLLARIPNQPVAVTFRECILDSKHAVSFWLTPILGSEITTSTTMINTLVQSVHWQDEKCVFAQGMDYLISRRLRTPNRKLSAGIFLLEKWKERCPQAEAGDPPNEQSSIECRIETNLPDGASLWESGRSPLGLSLSSGPGSIHRFIPELPRSLQDSISRQKL